MNEVITISSKKTVEDAIIEAKITLGIGSDELGYEVIEKGSVGLFGIGAKNAIIKAWKKEDAKEGVDALKSEEEILEERFEKVEEDNINDEASFIEPSKKKNIDFDKAISDAKSFLNMIMEDLDLNVELSITASIHDETLNIEIKGDDGAYIIGKRGRSLDGLQYLTSIVVNKNQDGFVHIVLDTLNYREKRRATLVSLAHNIAEKAKRTKKSVKLEPMTSFERRIIHTALENDKQVTTHSEGNEPYRRVVVTLKKHK